MNGIELIELIRQMVLIAILVRQELTMNNCIKLINYIIIMIHVTLIGFNRLDGFRFRN